MAGIVLPRVNRGEESAGEPRGLDMVFSSLGFIVGKAAAMGLGFVFWLIAARLASATAVGLTAGATSAIMLCGQFSLPGVGAALIGCYPDHRLRPQRLLDTVFTIGTVLGLVTGGAFLLLSTGLLEKLKVIASQPWFAAMFLAMSVFGTLGYVFDSVSMAQGRGDHVIVRNAANGLITIVPLILVPLFGIHPGSQALFGFWVFGAFTATVLALVQFGRAPGRYRYRPQADGQLVRRLMRTGLANQPLTLVEKAPGLILAIIVTELISPEANAYWYTVWMMAWLVYTIPISFGVGLYAEVVRRPETLAADLRRALAATAGLGVPAAVGLGVIAHPLLGLLGRQYAAAGTVPLRILLFGCIPFALVQLYFAVCRAYGRLGEAVATSAATIGLGLVAGVLGARTGSLTVTALYWVLTQAVFGVWAGWRMSQLVRPGVDLDSAVRPAPLAPARPLEPVMP